MYRPRFYNKKGQVVSPAEFEVMRKNFDRDMRVAYTEISEEVNVSTVLLEIDHRYLGDGPPIIFETMVFGMESDYMLRFSTLKEAQAGHKTVVALVREELRMTEADKPDWGTPDGVH